MKSQPPAQRGSVVLVALCLTLVLGVAVAGYVAVCARTMDMSNRSFCTTSSVQLAEIGMEEALWSLNQALNTSGYTWPGWTLAIVSGVPTATKQLTGFPTNKGIQSQVKIRIDNYNIDQNTTPPQSYTQPLTITVDGISLMPGGITIDKQLVATVKPAALFSNAVGSTGSSDLVSFVNASGGIVDSYDSTPTAPNNGIYTPYPYADPSIVNRSDQAIISGSLLNIQDAVILGYATTANSTPNPPSYFSTNGTVTRLTSTGATSTFPPIDYSRISNNANQYVFDFVASLPGSYAGNIDSLNFHDGSAVIGTPGGPLKRYDATALSLAGNDVLTINGPVIIDVSGNSVIPGDLTIQGSAKIVVTKGADPAHDGSAQIFIRDVAANMDIGGVADVYVADYDNHIIRKITPAGVVSTLAGMAGASGSTDGTGNAARFDFPSGVAVDSAGSVYVADTSNHTIRMITPTGVVSTLAGMAGASGSTDDTGSAARFSSPSGVIVDSSGNVYVADTGNDTIRKITPAREVTTLAGTGGSAGSADGTGSAARFNSPGGVAVDDAGNVYVADTSNHTIRKITPAGAVTTPAGSAGVQGSADGTGSAAQFNTPKAVAVDSAGNVYVADTSNDTIRKITPAGVVTTLAGSPGVPGSADGTGSAARFNLPGGVAVDYAENVYVADTSNDTIRKITPAGVVTTLAGSPGVTGSTNGMSSAALFDHPTGLAVDCGGIKNLTQRPSKLAIFRDSSPGGMVIPPSTLINTATPFYGVVYAPNFPLFVGSVSVNMTIYGALAGQSVTLNGTPTIHYDLNLRKATFSVVNTPYDVSQWIVSN